MTPYQAAVTDLDVPDRAVTRIPQTMRYHMGDRADFAENYKQQRKARSMRARTIQCELGFLGCEVSTRESRSNAAFPTVEAIVSTVPYCRGHCHGPQTHKSHQQKSGPAT